MYSQIAVNAQLPSLSLYEDFFEPIMTQSNNIIIRSKHKSESSKENRISDIAGCTVNGCSSPEEFKKMFSAMLDVSILAVYDHFKSFPNTYWQSHLSYIRNKLQELTLIVTDESIKFNVAYDKGPRQYQFKSFVNPSIVGFKDDFTQACGPWIRLSVEKYSEAWLKVISDALCRFELVFDLLKQDVQVNEDSIKYGPHPVIKFNLTVSQIGCLLKLFVKSGTIVVPYRQMKEMLSWVINNFQSQNQGSIGSKSLRNKYTTPDLSALDFLDDQIIKWQSVIKEESERLLK
jgi:hypothetical protein